MLETLTRAPMAIINCSECGRAVSDKAQACIGCGAPLAREDPRSVFNRAPVYTMTPPPTPAQLRWRLALSSLTLVLGVLAADASGRHAVGSRLAATLAALLLIVGLCWFLVAAVQSVQARRR
jgi:hypothetical protein